MVCPPSPFNGVQFVFLQIEEVGNFIDCAYQLCYKE